MHREWGLDGLSDVSACHYIGCILGRLFECLLDLPSRDMQKVRSVFLIVDLALLNNDWFLLGSIVFLSGSSSVSGAVASVPLPSALKHMYFSLRSIAA